MTVLLCAALFALVLPAAEKPVAVSVDSGTTPPCIAAGTPLRVETSGLKEKAYSGYRVWAFANEIPKDLVRARASQVRKDADYDGREVLDFAAAGKGRVPDGFPVDTSGLLPGDYRVNVVIQNRLHPFDFRVTEPTVPEEGEWEGALPLKWRLSDSSGGLHLSVVSAREAPVAFFVDPAGDGRTVYRMVFSPDGTCREARATDNNTNTDTFNFDPAWRSRASVRTRRGENGGWRLDAVIPFGAVDGGDAVKEQWGVFVSFDERVTHPADYPKRRFGRFVKATQAIDLVRPKGAVRKIGGQLAFEASATVRNRSPEFRLFTVRTTLETRTGEVLDTVEKPVAVRSGKAATVAFVLGAGKVKDGDAVRFRGEVLSPEGVLVRADWRETVVAYAPIALRMTEPCYRDCVFESMGLKRLVGVATLEEGVGKPLEIVLEGPATRETVRIASAQATNRFTFAFANKPKGEYFIRAGKAKKRIRNLPFQEGEFWVDGEGVMHRGKEKFFPFGYFSETFRRMYPGLNIAQEYNQSIRTTNAIAERLERTGKFGCGLILSPFQNLVKVPHDRLFGKEAAQGEFDAPPYAEQRREAVRLFVESVRRSPDFFAYYLQDEPEGRDLNPDFFRAAKELIAELDPYHPTMIVNYRVDAPPLYREAADILAIDKYCVYTVGGPTLGPREGVHAWAKAAADNGHTSMFSPQVFDWDYHSPKRITRAPTYDEIREQIALALIANTKGFLLYSRYSGNPSTCHLNLGPELVHRELLESGDLWLAPSESVELTADGGTEKVFAAVKRTKSDLALAAVNCNGKEVRVTFRAKGLPKALYLGGDKTPVTLDGGVLTATLPPYGTRIWYARPKAFSPDAARAQVEAAEAGRRKPGNLACAKRFLTWVELARVFTGKLDNGLPRIETSSTNAFTRYKIPQPYFLQDGIADTCPYLTYHGWAPQKGDKAPSVTVRLDGEQTVGCVVATCAATTDGLFPVTEVALEINGKIKGRQVRTAEDGRVEFRFSAVRTDKVVLRLVGQKQDNITPWLSEVEVYAPSGTSYK